MVVVVQTPVVVVVQTPVVVVVQLLVVVQPLVVVVVVQPLVVVVVVVVLHQPLVVVVVQPLVVKGVPPPWWCTGGGAGALRRGQWLQSSIDFLNSLSWEEVARYPGTTLRGRTPKTHILGRGSGMISSPSRGSTKVAPLGAS